MVEQDERRRGNDEIAPKSVVSLAAHVNGDRDKHAGACFWIFNSVILYELRQARPESRSVSFTVKVA
jgi:hypothetical protein